ncbi:MAG: hypothetical protein ABIO83_08160 [Ilumatobacteraceae bacterium]
MDAGADPTDRAATNLRGAVLPGALSGIIGGAAFGASIIETGALRTIASIARTDSAAVGLCIHIVVAIVVGIGFGLLVWFQRPGSGETLFWGLAYGAMWWFLGPMTLLPLLLGEPIAWNVEAARLLIPSLFGHLVYGAVTGLAFVVLTRGRSAATARSVLTAGACIRGAFSGLFGALALAAILDGQPDSPSISTSMMMPDRPTSWLVIPLAGAVAGIGFALLFPDPREGSGPMLIRGVVYGLTTWVAFAVTLIPIASGDGLRWSVTDIRASFETLPGYLLFIGAVPALLYCWSSSVARSLTHDGPAVTSQESAGAQGLHAIGAGAIAGLVGGTVFSIVLAQRGDLSGIAAMVANDSAPVGFVIHLFTSVLIGVGYGLIFVRRSNDISSALGWGTSYGVFWWLMGSLTLLPILAGDVPRWSVDAAIDAYPELIGHLVYGAFLGVVFYRIEARFDPWWFARNESEQRRAIRAADQLAGSAPALWVVTVLFALAIPLLLAP